MRKTFEILGLELAFSLEFAKILGLLEQFVLTVKGQNNVWQENAFLTCSWRTIIIQIGKKILWFRNMLEKSRIKYNFAVILSIFYLINVTKKFFFQFSCPKQWSWIGIVEQIFCHLQKPNKMFWGQRQSANFLPFAKN